MSKSIWCFLLSVGFNYLLTEMIHAQPDSLKQNLFENTFTRHRLFIGYAGLLPQYENDENRALFLNYNHRSTGIDKTDKPFKTVFAFEPGLNILLSYKFNNEKWKETIALIPYLKTGPEIYFGQNIFLAGSIGMGMVLIGNSFYVPIIPILFAGLNSFYLIDIPQIITLEFEAGFHTFAGPKKAPFLYYLNIGFSFN